MRISRTQFVEQFFPAFIVRVLSAWKRRGRTSHEVVAIYLYDSITVSNGRVPIPKSEFIRIVTPMIDKLIAATHKGEKPDARNFAGLTYDVLDQAEVEIEIKPPVRSHGGGANRG